MPGSPAPLKGFLDNAALASIRAQLDVQGRLLRVVRQGLPEFMGSHCRHCVLKEDCLLIYVDSPAFASQVRFYGPSLLAHIESAAGLRVRNIQVRNLLPAAPKPAEKIRPAPPSQATGEMLRTAAENSPSGEIKDALLRLSQTLEEMRRN
jgi:hypothetical protein